jgi:hypothetical protein
MPTQGTTVACSKDVTFLGNHLTYQNIPSQKAKKKHDKKRLNRGRSTTTVTGTYSKVTKNRQTYDNDELSSVVAASDQQNTQLCKNDESQSLMSSNNSIYSEFKELQEKTLALTATVASLEQLTECNMTTTQTILRDTLDAMAMLALERSANDQASTELRSTIIPTMRQELVDTIDSLHNSIDSGFSNMRAMFKQMPNWEQAPVAESPTTTTAQATTCSNSLYYVIAENEMIDVTNQKQKTVYNKERDKDKTTEPRKIFLTRELRRLKDSKSNEESVMTHKRQNSISMCGDSKRDVTGGGT